MSLGKTGRSSTIWLSVEEVFFERKTLVEHSMSFTAHAAFFGEFLEVSFFHQIFFFSPLLVVWGEGFSQQGKTSTVFILLFFCARFTEKCGPNDSGTSFFFLQI